MGTSQSNPGAPPGSPLVPPWVPPLVDDDDDDVIYFSLPDDTQPGNEEQPMSPIPFTPTPVAPNRRFGSSRRSLGNFAKTGSTDDLRKGLGHYTKTSLGGTKTATARMGRTVRIAHVLYEALTATANGQTAAPGSQLDPIILAGKDVHEVIGAVVEAVSPTDGTLDGEASRESIQTALSDLLGRFPGASLLSLSEEQREYVVERFVALDVYQRFNLDVGKAIHAKAPTPKTALERLREARDYIKETVSFVFSDLRAKGQKLRVGQIKKTIRIALERTFRVFEEYIQ